MRICYLCPDPGIHLGGTKGAAAHVRDLVGGFATLGHEVMVLAASPDGGDPVDFPCFPIPAPRIVQGFPGEAKTPLVRALGHLWNNGAVESKLVETLRRYQPDLVYERYSPFGVAGGIVSAGTGVRHVLEVNAPLSWEGSRYRNQAMGDVARLLETTAFDITSLLIAVSKELKSILIDDGVDEDRIQVVPNGVNADRFSDQGEAEPVAPADRLVIGFVGSLKPWHGIETLARAFRILVSEGSYHLLVVGNGPENRIVRSLQEEHPDFVTHVKAVSHPAMPRYLRAMDVALAPYPVLERFYFSPLKVLEYMATGRAIVASAVGQIEDLIVSGQTGLLVPPGDPQALVEAISYLRDNPDRAKTMGAAAAAVARSSHLWTHRAEEILSFVGGPAS